MQRVTLPSICKLVGISDVTGRRYMVDYNDSSARKRGFGEWRGFDPEEVPAVIRHLESKRQRRCLNRYNSAPIQ